MGILRRRGGVWWWSLRRLTDWHVLRCVIELKSINRHDLDAIQTCDFIDTIDRSSGTEIIDCIFSKPYDGTQAGDLSHRCRVHSRLRGEHQHDLAFALDLCRGQSFTITLAQLVERRPCLRRRAIPTR